MAYLKDSVNFLNKTLADSSRLTEKQKRFCEEYVIDYNGQAAYIRAGYKTSGASARVNASRLLAEVSIQEYIFELTRQVQERTGITADMVLEELRRIGFSDVKNVLSFNSSGVTFKNSDDLPPEITAAIESVTAIVTVTEERETVKMSVKMHNKLSALDSLAQHLGMKNDLNWAWKVLEGYGYKREAIENGYKLIDQYADQGSTT